MVQIFRNFYHFFPHLLIFTEHELHPILLYQGEKLKLNWVDMFVCLFSQGKLDEAISKIILALTLLKVNAQ